MITTSDINKLKTVFVTKEDLKKELKKELSNYPTKDDLKNELQKYATKEELQLELKKQSAFIVKEIADVVLTLSEGIQQSLNELKGHHDILENHEHRLDKLEDKAFSSN